MPHVMPLVYLLVGYWLPASARARAEHRRSSSGCSTSIARCSGRTGSRRFERSAPRLVLEYLELSYLLCYAVVPAGYVCLLLAGYRG